ncbi:MAG: glutamate formimidoyltransferase [Gammaproteobacteria bacterium]|nr:glutamate formimidoyltransferase [Gammaproteobacteria bacterium]
MSKLVECVPNFSEGRDAGVIRSIAAEIEAVSGVTLLDVDPGADTHRTVITFVGPPEAVVEAAFRAGKRAAETIDMTRHHGSHARMGAMDVCPFVPVAGVTMADCVELAQECGRRIGDLGIPVYLYEHAATNASRKNLAVVRAGEYEGLTAKLAQPEWRPDFGPATHNPRTGAFIIGAREFLIAYNVNLATSDKRYADDIAYNLRERGRYKRNGNVAPFYYKGEVVTFGANHFPCGACDQVAQSWDALAAHYRDAHGKDLAARYAALDYTPDAAAVVGKPVYADGRFSHVKAVGWVVDKYRRAQISINLTDFKVTPAHAVLEAAREEAALRGITVTGSEIVGVVPFDAMLESGRHYLRRMHKSTGLPVGDVIETAVQAMGLRDVAPFETEKKVLGLPPPAGELVRKTVGEFVDEVSRDTPAPGGGSIAALAGSIGAALAAMVANLTAGKAEFAGRYEELDTLATSAQAIKDSLLAAVDADTQAFNGVMDALRLPKDTPEQKSTRSQALLSGYKHATEVPLQTARQCRAALELCLQAARCGNDVMITDAGVGALVALAGVKGAAYNARINLKSIKDPAFVERVGAEIARLIEESRGLAGLVEREVERVIG